MWKPETDNQILPPGLSLIDNIQGNINPLLERDSEMEKIIKFFKYSIWRYLKK